MVNSRFLQACKGQPTDRPPLWMMRQAGRYLPEYRAVREKAKSFLNLCRTPDLAVEVTLQPIKRFGFDAAILFSDILIPAQAMGAEVTFEDGEGPRIANPVRSKADAERLRNPDAEEACPFVYEAIRALRKELDGQGGPPLVGFAAAPWTLASYLVEGETSRGFELSRSFLLGEPDAAKALLDRVVRMTTDYLIAQVEAGVQALQLFDTWAGLLSPRDYKAVALPALRSVLRDVRKEVGADVPLIYFVNGVAGVIEDVASVAEIDVLSIDWRMDLAEARRRSGGKKALQGNLDPAVLLAGAAAVRARVPEILAAGGGRGHIMNLGHGVLPKTSIGAVEALVEIVRSAKGGA